MLDVEFGYEWACFGHFWVLGPLGPICVLVACMRLRWQLEVFLEVGSSFNVFGMIELGWKASLVFFGFSGYRGPPCGPDR